MKKLLDKEIKLFQFLDKNVGDKQDKKTAIKYLKEYLGFTPEEVLKYYSLWYYSSGGDYETYEYDEEGELLNFINSISILSSEQINEITDDLYDSGKLDKLLGDFFNANCGGWRSTTPCITFESGGITVELDRENWEEYFSGLGDDDLWMYYNAFSSYTDYYEEVMEDEFDYAYYNDDTIEYLETIAILAGQNSWPGKNNEKINDGEIKDFLNKTLPSSNVEDIINNYLSDLSVEITRVRLEAVRNCYNDESKYNTNEARCNSGDYCIFIPYEDLKELIIDKNMLNLSDLKDVEVNDDIYLNDCYYDAWLDDEGHDSCIRELNRSLERTIEKITEDDELDLEQFIKDRKEFFNMMDKFGFRRYTTTTGGYYKSEDGKIDLHTDNINFKDRKIKFTYDGKTHMVPFEDFPNWVGGSVLDLNESVKIKKKLLKEQKENITKISIFDFDGTLMDTPHPEEGKKEWEEFTGKKYPHIGWWGKPESLDDAVFDIQPIESTVSDYKKEMSNPDTMVIMLTGRLPHQSEQIEELLALHNINFDEYHYKSNGDTLSSKINTIKSLLNRYPNVTEIEMWEDREPHALSFEQWGKDNNINLNVNLVRSGYINNINENKDIDPKQRYVNGIVNIIRLPYFNFLEVNEVPRELWKDILSKVFNQKVIVSYNSIYDSNNYLLYNETSDGFWEKREYDSNNYLIYYEDSDGYWTKREYDFNKNEIYYETSDGYWRKREYDENNNEIYFETSDGFWSKSEYDSNNNEIYYEDSDGRWRKREYDFNNNEIYYENSDGFWTKREYDSNNNEIYFENSVGVIRDNRSINPINENIDSKQKYINGISRIIRPPYYNFLRVNEVPEELWNDIFSKVFNREVIKDNRIIYDSNNNRIYYENTNGMWSKREYDSNNNKIYYEDSNGHWEKREYDENNNIIYYEDSNGLWGKYEYDENNNEIYRENSFGEIIDNRPSNSLNENINPKQRYINGIGDIIRLPYFRFLKLNEVPKELWDDIFYRLFNQEVIVSDNRIYDENNNEIYFETSDGFWTKSEYDENNNEIYYETSDGYWRKREYDENNNEIYFETSDGFWTKSEYDENNNEIYYEDSDGEIIDNRPINPINENKDIDPIQKYINGIVNIIRLPYFRFLKLNEVPEELWEDIFSKVFNTKVTYSDNSTLRYLRVTEPTEWYVNNEDNKLLYTEDDSGFWIQMEYDESGKLIHQIDRDDNVNRIVPMDEW